MTRLDKVAYSLVIFICLAALMYCGYDNMQDQEKSAEVLSNAKHIAKLDAAERRREAIEQAFLQQEGLSAGQVRFVATARGDK
jgi:hypothetical protein